jgi:hypothetical protein
MLILTVAPIVVNIGIIHKIVDFPVVLIVTPRFEVDCLDNIFTTVFIIKSYGK